MLALVPTPDRSTADAERTRDYYDRLGRLEEDRLVQDVAGRVSFEVHRRLLAEHVRAGDRVLEIGAGPGRFTAELARLGARVVVTDLSPVQLDLNRENLTGTADEGNVERRELLDVCDLSRYDDYEFDVVVAYGGPLSYAFEAEESAVRGLLRVTRSGGRVLASVMSMLGTWRHAPAGVTALAEALGEDVNDRVLATGDLRHVGGEHQCRMFRAHEVVDLVERAGGHVLATSASNWASLADPDVLGRVEADPDRWARFLDHEVQACREPGALDGGTHVLVAAEPRP
ncbi:methyltransferase type 12 [Cellulomonas carbonis T26]|uniref:Methyltransferase type 12 n=2 Tax=Cellulomonas carbonis TaxID=1386092 RepID=A0A0A0BM19_9CELL|nr:methyltransferase type 12 [Cellulomonas carbonis T26]